MTITPLADADRDWLGRYMVAHWGTPIVVGHGVAMRPAALPGFVAEHEGRCAGVITYQIVGRACEIVTLDSDRPGMGVGTALLDAVVAAARRQGCARVWLVTTNDNLHALRFYQKRGFALAAVHPRAVERSRQIKPEIPLIGHDGIPIRDEIELELLPGKDTGST